MWWLYIFIALFSVVFVKFKMSKRHRPPREPKLLEAPGIYLSSAPQDLPAREAVLNAAELQVEDHTVSLPPLVSYYHWEPAVLFWGLSDRITWKLQRAPRKRFRNRLRRLWKPIRVRYGNRLRRFWRPIQARYGNRLWHFWRSSQAWCENRLRHLWRSSQAWCENRLRSLWGPIEERYGKKLRWYALGAAVVLVGVGLWLWLRS